LWPAQRWLIHTVNPAATVYFAEDDHTQVSGAGPAFAEHQRVQEQRLLAECDLALSVSPVLLERFRAVQPNSHLQENGVDLEQFTPSALDAAETHPLLVDRPRPRLGFVGQVDERVDQELVAALARRFAQGVVVMAGRVKPGLDV